MFEFDDSRCRAKVSVSAGCGSCNIRRSPVHNSQTFYLWGTLSGRRNLHEWGTAMAHRYRTGILAGFLMAAPGFAQALKPVDPISAAKAKQNVADQEFDSDVREQVENLTKLARTHHAKALADLKALDRKLALRNDINPKLRDTLSAYIDARIVAIDKGAATIATPPIITDPKLAERKEANRKAWDAAVTEAKEVQEAVSAIAKDYDAGRVKEAQQREAALALKYPNNPAVFSMSRQAGNRDAIADAKWIADLQGQRFRLALNEVQKSAIPIAGDIEFPKDWNERMARRRKMEPELLGPEEKAIIKSLDMKVEKSLKGIPFDEAIQSLSTLIDKNIYLDKQSIEDLGVDLRKPVDVPANVDARSVLRSMLQTQGLTFIVRDKIIQVMSVEKARQNMVTRSYEIRDIVQNSTTAFGAGSLNWGPYVDYQQTMQNAQLVIDAIVGGIDPRVWSKNGGPASITFHYPSMSIIVRAPAEVHSSLSSNLKR